MRSWRSSDTGGRSRHCSRLKNGCVMEFIFHCRPSSWHLDSKVCAARDAAGTPYQSRWTCHKTLWRAVKLVGSDPTRLGVLIVSTLSTWCEQRDVGLVAWAISSLGMTAWEPEVDIRPHQLIAFDWTELTSVGEAEEYVVFVVHRRWKADVAKVAPSAVLTTTGARNIVLSLSMSLSRFTTYTISSRKALFVPSPGVSTANAEVKLVEAMLMKGASCNLPLNSRAKCPGAPSVPAGEPGAH